LYILAIYVDDCLLVGRTGPFILAIKASFGLRFDIEDLGPASWLLGCSIVRGRVLRNLTLSQSLYMEDIRDHFGMSCCHPSPIPISSKPTLNVLLDLPLDVKTFPFPSLIGKLLYRANMSRPDISDDVSLLNRHMSSPTARHWE
jgi:hypothetical protein